MKTKDITDFMVCQAVKEVHLQKTAVGFRFSRAVEILKDQTGAPRKVCESAVNKSISKGLVESGIIFSIGWLTNEGIEYLESKLHD
jgi:xanthine dehydrogenase molybdopterin-binding subunit B